MKNKYKFCNLEKIEFDFKDKQADIFFEMNNLVEQNGDFLLLDSIDELLKVMKHNTYFVAHKSISYKGKSRFFTGDIAVASKKSLLYFIKKSIIEEDLRSMLVAPLFEKSPPCVIYINEDAVFMYYENNVSGM